MNPYFQLTETSVSIPGLDRPYTLLHISDLHLMEADERSTEEERAEAEKENRHWEKGALDFAKIFGDSTDPVHQPGQKGILERFLDLTAELRPDALIMTGDTMEYYSESNERYLREKMAACPVPYMMVRGNHELDEHPMWKEFCGSSDEVRTIQVGNLKLIGLDDASHEVSESALKALQAEAGKDIKAGEAANPGFVPILCYHVPVWTEEDVDFWKDLGEYFTVDPAVSKGSTLDFIHWVKDPKCPIDLCLCGHIHGRSETHLSPKTLQLTASSAMLGSGNLIHLVPKT